MTQSDYTLTVAIAQIAPVWLDRRRTTDKIVAYIERAAAAGAQLVAFGEALLPGYPSWLSRTDGARFNDPQQKELHAHYLLNSVQIEAGHLEPICAAAAQGGIAVYLGIVERPADRGGHSVYASLVYIDGRGEICSVHRKLQPTYEERLCWSPGDGNGLQVHQLSPFTVGGLNCWENWMPLTRTALYALGENLHVAVWPGSVGLTRDITRFVALESRSFVISACGILRPQDIAANTPQRERIVAGGETMFADGGSCIAGPDGSWVIEPLPNQEELLTATIDYRKVLEERQNFDPTGHYSRPDVTQLVVDRGRQSIAVWR